MDTKSDFHRLLWLLPIAIGSTSTALYFRQGGFGAGHGDFDRILYVLAMPWSLVPLPDAVFPSDFIWLIVVPFVLDSVLVALLARWLRGSRRGSR